MTVFQGISSFPPALLLSWVDYEAVGVSSEIATFFGPAFFPATERG